MKSFKFWSAWLLLLCLASFIIPFVLANVIGKTELFLHTGFERYSWLFYVFTPFSICSIIVGHKDGKWTFDYGFGWFDFGVSINFLEIWKWLTGR